LKVLLSTSAGIGLASVFGKSAVAETPDKVKMLTPDGKLVEIDRSLVEKGAVSKRASNEDVKNWMNIESNKS